MGEIAACAARPNNRQRRAEDRLVGNAESRWRQLERDEQPRTLGWSTHSATFSRAFAPSRGP
jgi:hypothetical protein